MAKIKLKTRKAAAKRFRKVSAKGKITRGQQGHGHFLSRRGGDARKLAGTTLVSDDNYNMIARMLPMFPAKKRRTKALKAAAARAKAAKATN